MITNDITTFAKLIALLQNAKESLYKKIIKIKGVNNRANEDILTQIENAISTTD